MYNLLIALGCAALGFLLGWFGGNTWVAGIFPAFLALFVSYFLLARRTGQQLEAIMRRAMAEVEALKPEKLAAIAQRTRSDKAVREAQQSALRRVREIMNEGFALAPWQFLVASQLHAQIGALDYQEGNYEEARKHLSKAWNRNWMAQVQLAAIEWREDKKSEALKRLDKAKGGGEKEALFWGVFAWMAMENGDKERALQLLGEGLKKLPANKPLTEMADAVRNQRRFQPRIFGDAWYQFFPEQITEAEKQAMAQRYMQPKGAYRPPQPRHPRR